MPRRVKAALILTLRRALRFGPGMDLLLRPEEGAGGIDGEEDETRRPLPEQSEGQDQPGTWR